MNISRSTIRQDSPQSPCSNSSHSVKSSLLRAIQDPRLRSNQILKRAIQEPAKLKDHNPVEQPKKIVFKRSSNNISKYMTQIDRKSTRFSAKKVQEESAEKQDG
jgi:hypothetical protein